MSLNLRLYNIATFGLAYTAVLENKKDKTHTHRKKYHHNKPTLTQLTKFFTVSSCSKNYVHWSFPRDENRPYQKSTLTLFLKYLLHAHCTTTAVTVASCKKSFKMYASAVVVNLSTAKAYSHHFVFLACLAKWNETQCKLSL